MEFRFTPEQEEFRQEVRGFLREALPEGWRGVYPDSYFEDEYWGLIREFTARLVQRGWLTMAWPVEYGGKGLSVLDQMVYNEEQSYYRAPQRDLSTGVNLVAPTVMVHGYRGAETGAPTPDQGRRACLLPGLQRAGVGVGLSLAPMRRRGRRRRLRCQRLQDLDERRPPLEPLHPPHPHRP